MTNVPPYVSDPFSRGPSSYIQHTCQLCGHKYRLRSELPQPTICHQCVVKREAEEKSVKAKRAARVQTALFVLQVFVSVVLILFGVFRLFTKRKGNALDFAEGVTALVGGAYVGSRAVQSRRRRRSY